jgi:hypothetical protein
MYKNVNFEESFFAELLLRLVKAVVNIQFAFTITLPRCAADEAYCF